MRFNICLPIYTLLVYISCFYFHCNALLADKSVSPGDTVTVLSYNVENLFDCHDNGTEYPEYKPGPDTWNHETQAIKLANIASAIAAARADILVLVEIENGTAAKQLQKVLTQKKCRYPYYAVGDKPNPTTTCQAVLSRYPVVNHRGHGIPKRGDYYTRNILEADIALGDHVLKIFALHWPSKRFTESYRIAAANVLLHRLHQLPTSTEYIIAGDLNSNYNEAETFFTERLDDTDGTTALNHILKTALSPPGACIDFVNEQELIALPESLYHYDPWLELPEYKRFCYTYHGHHNTLDHILLPRSLYDSAGISYVDNSFAVFTWQGRLLYNGAPYRWNTKYGRRGKYHVGEGYSDHLPIMIKLAIRPFCFADTGHTVSRISKSRPGAVSFETGCEGWLPYSGQFHVTRDTGTASDGTACLKIEGLAQRSGSAAHCRIPIQQHGVTTGRSVKCTIKGTGRLALRIRFDDGPWTCYAGNDFSRKLKSTRYTSLTSAQWQNLRLSLPEIPHDAEAFEMQIRAAGGEVLCVWLDNIQFSL